MDAPNFTAPSHGYGLSFPEPSAPVQEDQDDEGWAGRGFTVRNSQSK